MEEKARSLMLRLHELESLEKIPSNGNEAKTLFAAAVNIWGHSGLTLNGLFFSIVREYQKFYLEGEKDDI